MGYKFIAGQFRKVYLGGKNSRITVQNQSRQKSWRSYLKSKRGVVAPTIREAEVEGSLQKQRPYLKTKLKAKGLRSWLTVLSSDPVSTKKSIQDI
jgi:hypothetical protein